MLGPVIALLLIILQGLFWGFITQMIIDNKGRNENWFWWGFFFGLIAVLVALSKSHVVHNYDSYNSGLFVGERDRVYEKNVIEDGGWKCHFCNRVNPSYTGTCACGRTKTDTLNYQRINKEQMDSLDKIKKLKELLDMGALTQEEFDAKKKEFLNDNI